jgi:hypothetical protein
VCGVLRQKTEPDVVGGAQLGDVGGHVGRQIVADNHLDVIVWQGLDMSQENLSSRVLHTGTLGTGDQKKLTQRAKLPLNIMHFLFVQRMRKNVIFLWQKRFFFGEKTIYEFGLTFSTI